MKYLISNENIKVPNMIYGTAWKKDNTTHLVKTAIKSGFKGVDTACQPRHYQEDLVGIALKECFDEGILRNDIFIQTKFTPLSGQDQNNMPYKVTDSLKEQVQKSFEKSKKNLNLQYIDSYILHTPILPIAHTLTVWEQMQEFYYNREIGQLGISNCYDLETLQYLYNNSDIKPSVVQNRFYNHTNYDKDIRIWCNENGIIYQSFWSLTANPHLLNSNIIKNLSSKYKKTVEQVFYKYLNSINIIPLNGTTSKEHMKKDLDLDSFELPQNEVDLINEIL